MRLKEKYQKEILPALKKDLGIKNNFLAPKIEKVVLNVGFGKHTKEKEYAANVAKTLNRITGQKSVFTKSKKSVAAFKIREGMVIGAMVTLRGERMYDFIERLVNITFPRVRDFRGISDTIIDRDGNMTIGFKEHLPFPEIKQEDIDNIHGLEITIVTSTQDRAAALELFRLLGFPFKKN
ncbi:MAG: 50S ribosomal protein L5 [Candidatus Falkowbacteria bacterium]